MSRYVYPTLPRGDIISFLADYVEIGVSDSDIRHPNPDSLSNIYTRLLIFLGLLNEDYEQVDFGALEQLEDPNNHITSVRVMNLLNKMKVCLASIDCPRNFSLKDLVKPDPDRTELFLGSLINFCIYRESKMELLRTIVEEHGLISEQRKELEDKILQLNAEIDEVNESKEREKPLVQAVEAKVNELRQTIPSLNNQQLSLKANLNKMKDKGRDIDQKISSAEFAWIQIGQENTSLRSRIVQSPDKLQKALEEKKVVRTEAKDAETVSMKTYQEKSSILEVYTKSHKKVSKVFDQVQAIQEQVSSAKTNEKVVKALKDQLSDEDILDKTLEAKLVERQGRVEQVIESIKQLEKEKNNRYEEATKGLNNVKFDVELRRRDLESNQKQLEVVVAEVNAIDVDIKAVKEAGDALRQKLAGKSEEIVTAFFKYTNSIGGQLQTMELEREFEHEST